MTASDRLAFLGAAMRRPGRVGAIAPSSARLGAVLASVVPTSHPSTVVELGPGTGSVSDVVTARLASGSRHLAVELDPAMIARLRRTHPTLELVEGDARHLTALLTERGVSHADAVVCGLPWALFDQQLQEDVLGEVRHLIAPDGAFATFAYRHAMVLPAARRFRDTLRDVFDQVEVTPTVWRNLPPAFVYVCR